jgi:5-methylcytosine-specific restriction endonuclease McrA
MIITDTVEIKISVSNMKYWKEMGYQFDNPAPRWGIIPKIEVLVDHLQKNSNVEVDCLCDKCGKKYTQRYSRNTRVCYPCRKAESMIGNTLGENNRGKKLLSITGENHPRWNPDKDSFQQYKADVARVTRQQDLTLLENNDKPRGLCGVNGAYQLDHIVPVKYGYDNGIPAKEIGHISNLRIIPWQENRAKWDKSIGVK